MRQSLCLAILVVPLPLLAQEAAPAAPESPPAQEILGKALAKMAQLGGYKFRTTEVQDSAMNRQIMRQVGGGGQAVLGELGGGEVGVRGEWTDGVLRFKLNDDADEVVTYRGRMIARNEDAGWKLRRDRLASGQQMPFALDPTRLFESLQSLPAGALKLKHQQATEYKGKPVMILGITLEDDDAQDFALSGALPPVSSVGGAMVFFAGGGGRMGGAPMPDLTVDLAFSVDPATGYVHRVQAHAYQKSAAAGNFQIQIQGAGAGAGGEDDEEEEEEEVKERDDQGNRNYRRGLPVRKLAGDTSKLAFDVVFSDHAMPMKLELDERARQLLRLPSVTAPATDK